MGELIPDSGSRLVVGIKLINNLIRVHALLNAPGTPDVFDYSLSLGTFAVGERDLVPLAKPVQHASDGGIEVVWKISHGRFFRRR